MTAKRTPEEIACKILSPFPIIWNDRVEIEEHIAEAIKDADKNARIEELNKLLEELKELIMELRLDSGNRIQILRKIHLQQVFDTELKQLQGDKK